VVRDRQTGLAYYIAIVLIAINVSSYVTVPGHSA
jgi:hypothetical protein